MVKDWQKLSEEELANLSEKEVEFYKKLLYAQEGIEFPEKPKEIDSINIQPDKTVYMVSFLDDIYFEELGEAKVVIETLKKCKTLGHINKKDWSKETYFELGTPIDYYGNHKTIDVTTKNCYSKESYLKSEETINTYDRLRKKYEQDKNNYERVLEKAIKITEDFTNKLEDARENIARRKRLSSKYYLEYLPLADNNEEIAMGFMKKAYIISEEDEKYIKTHKIEESN